MASRRKYPKKLTALQAQRDKIDALGVPKPHQQAEGGGMRTKMTELTLGKLEIAFSYGCSDEEACCWSGINPDTLYEYQKENPTYSERKRLLKQMPTVAARQSVSASFPKRPDIAMRYLEAKLPDEFNVKVQHHHTGEVKINYSEELDKRSKPYEPAILPSDIRAVENGSEGSTGIRTDGIHPTDTSA